MEVLQKFGIGTGKMDVDSLQEPGALFKTNID